MDDKCDDDLQARQASIEPCNGKDVLNSLPSWTELKERKDLVKIGALGHGTFGSVCHYKVGRRCPGEEEAMTIKRMCTSMADEDNNLANTCAAICACDIYLFAGWHMLLLDALH